MVFCVSRQETRTKETERKTMAKHSKNKRFGGESFEPVRKAKPVGQGALDRDRQRKLERGAIRPIDTDEDFFSSYSDESY